MAATPAIASPLIVMVLAVVGSDLVVELARSTFYYSCGSLGLGLGIYVIQRRRQRAISAASSASEGDEPRLQ
jgi:hypothetical protein